MNKINKINKINQVMFKKCGDYWILIKNNSKLVKKQQTGYNCWAACVASVGQYKTSINYDSNYVAEHEDKLYGGDGTDICLTLYNIYTLDSYYSYDPFYFNTLKTHIDSDRPVIAIYKSDNYRYAVVLCAYNSSSSSASYAYMDSSDGAIHTSSIIQDGNFTFISGGYVFTLENYNHLW